MLDKSMHRTATIRAIKLGKHLSHPVSELMQFLIYCLLFIQVLA
jgi:hypothetical protein